MRESLETRAREKEVWPTRGRERKEEEKEVEEKRSILRAHKFCSLLSKGVRRNETRVSFLFDARFGSVFSRILLAWRRSWPGKKPEVQESAWFIRRALRSPIVFRPSNRKRNALQNVLGGGVAALRRPLLRAQHALPPRLGRGTGRHAVREEKRCFFFCEAMMMMPSKLSLFSPLLSPSTLTTTTESPWAATEGPSPCSATTASQSGSALESHTPQRSASPLPRGTFLARVLLLRIIPRARPRGQFFGTGEWSRVWPGPTRKTWPWSGRRRG